MFFALGNSTYPYLKQDPTLYDTNKYANVNIYFAVKSSKDYDQTTTKVMDAVAEILNTREWTAGSKLDIPEDGE